MMTGRGVTYQSEFQLEDLEFFSRRGLKHKIPYEQRCTAPLSGLCLPGACACVRVQPSVHD